MGTLQPIAILLTTLLTLGTSGCGVGSECASAEGSEFGAQTPCNDGTCIALSSVCDGRTDCAGGEDERGCPGTALSSGGTGTGGSGSGGSNSGVGGPGSSTCSICASCETDFDCVGAEWCAPFSEDTNVCTMECDFDYSCPGNSECWTVEADEGDFYICLGSGDEPCAGFSCR